MGTDKAARPGAFCRARRQRQRPPGRSVGCGWAPLALNPGGGNVGIGTTDTQTRETKQLHTGCDTRVYLNPDVSADGRTILVRRIDRKSVDDGQEVYQESNLWLMDIDGRNERKIVF